MGSNPEFFKAYVAGFFDGEGSINLSLKANTTFRSVSVTLAQKRKDILAEIQTVFGGKLTLQKKGYHTLEFCGKDSIKPLLTALLPHLRVKFQEASLALQILELTGYHLKLSEREQLLRFKLEESFLELRVGQRLPVEQEVERGTEVQNNSI